MRTKIRFDNSRPQSNSQTHYYHRAKCLMSEMPYIIHIIQIIVFLLKIGDMYIYIYITQIFYTISHLAIVSYLSRFVVTLQLVRMEIGTSTGHISCKLYTTINEFKGLPL